MKPHIGSEVNLLSFIKHMRTALDAVKRVKMLSTKSQLVLVGASFLDRSESAVSKNQMNVTIDYFTLLPYPL